MPIIDQDIGKRYAIYHSDTMEVLPTLPSESVDLSLYSPPFPELYQYSDDVRDMTNCVNYEESIEQYRFVVEQVSRLTKSGRMSCVHCTDLKRGSLYQRDFPGDVVRVHEDCGMHFFCRITIWKDAWEFARRTRMRSLRHMQICEDSAMSRTCPPDYILVFKKPGANAVPIPHPKGFKDYVGSREVPPALLRDFGNYKGDPRKNLLSHWIWRQYADPVWDDIRRGRMLPFEQARENVEEKHVCPLQLDVIERCLLLWSNENDVVLSPFMGVGSEVCGALYLGRRAIGVELKQTYYRQSKRNVQATLEDGRTFEKSLPMAAESLEEDEDLVEME